MLSEWWNYYGVLQLPFQIMIFCNKNCMARWDSVPEHSPILVLSALWNIEERNCCLGGNTNRGRLEMAKPYPRICGTFRIGERNIYNTGFVFQFLPRALSKGWLALQELKEKGVCEWRFRPETRIRAAYVPCMCRLRAVYVPVPYTHNPWKNTQAYHISG
jgi:hypothetical protein